MMSIHALLTIVGTLSVLVLEYAIQVHGCQFYPLGEYLRFVRVPENLPVGDEVLRINVHPRQNLSIQPIDKNEDLHYFSFREVNQTTISLILARTLDNLVDTDNPRNVLKFRLICDYNDGEDVVSSYLSVTVYVEDINDHAPKFIESPYHVTVDELTPVGLTIFRGIQAFDRDKPNTPNSDVQYSITAGNEKGKFALESSHRAFLIVKSALDYDAGDTEFLLTLTASDRGSPPKSTNTTIKITIIDNDDLNPKFTQSVYKTKIEEFYPITGDLIHQELIFDPQIFAYDQDLALDSEIRYDIIAGNERQLFLIDPKNGTLYLEKEIDLDAEKRLPGNTFVLQIQASQIDNPLKAAVARVEVEVVDINDNLPEFEVDFYNISIVENLPNGFSVLQVIATDIDQGVNGEFAYVLDDDSGAFNLDSRNGWLTVRDQSVLDREKQTSLSMIVYAKEKSKSVIIDPTYTSSVIVDVTLLDANDNNPKFIPSNLYEFTISNDGKIGDIVGQVQAIDPDLGRNGMVLYDIQRTTNGSVKIPFNIDPQNGNIIVSEIPLIQGRHALLVEASDQPANPSERRYSLAVITVEVLKVGKEGEDDTPDFIGAPYEFWVGGNVGIGTSVGQIRINDAAKKSNVLYDLLHSYHEGVPFAVEERSGTITVIDELSKFERQLYDFESVVSNEKDFSLVTNVTIHVVDPDDEKGILMRGTNSSPIEFHVRENMSGALIGRLFYANSTKNSSKALRFVIANQQDVTDYIAISQDGTLYTKKGLDREERDIYRLTVIAEYHKGFVSGAGIYQVTVIVDDENDNAPIFSQPFYEGHINENSPLGTEVTLSNLINATDKDKGVNSKFSLSLIGEGHDLFIVNQTTGKVTFRGKTLDREEKSLYNFRLVAKDRGSLSSEVKLTIFIDDENDNAPEFLQMVILSDNGVDVVEFDETFSNLSIIEEKLSNKTGVATLLQRSISTTGHPTTQYKAPLVSLPENVSVGSSILRFLAYDKDSGENAVVRYEIVSETYIPNAALAKNGIHLIQYFTVHQTKGEIIVARTLPAEAEFRIILSASDKDGLEDKIMVRIHVSDINDHPPIFRQSWYSFNVNEAVYSRSVIGKIEASDEDYGQNANISYGILSKIELPFTISEFTGVLHVNGELDRETKDKYNFKIIARDNAKKNERLSSMVDVEVNILDVNDNAPSFYGYDKLIENPHPEATEIPNHNFDSVMLTPIYFASVPENSPIGTVVTRVFANDSDFLGNGNGLLLFDIPQRKNHDNLFTIDSKDGVVTTIGKLDYETQSVYNVTIVASDLGSPSLSSSALLIISVIDVPEEVKNTDNAVFSHRYYEVEVEENVPVPLTLLKFNVTDFYKDMNLKYSIVARNGSDIQRTFKIDPRNGTLYLVRSPDREEKAMYEVVIRVEQVKMSRGMTSMIYPINPEKLNGLRMNELKVLVKISDVNDNAPKFVVSGRPIVAAIPTSANFGYQIVRLQATDPDEGINGDIRYQMLGRGSTSSSGNRLGNESGHSKFAIDSLTGQVRAVGSFARDAGRVFGFDVKATDKRGADDGKSTIANVFVYVLDEDKQLVMVMDSKPTEIERSMANITSTLHNVTGYDVRIRKLEPHFEKNLIDHGATDMYLYAVDPNLNVIVEMNQLEKMLQNKQQDIEQQLKPHKVLDIASGISEHGHSRSERFLLSTLEIGVVILGCLIFIVALISAICIGCFRKRRSLPHHQLPTNFQTHLATPIGYAISSVDQLSKSGISNTALFPRTFESGFHHYTEPDSELPYTSDEYNVKESERRGKRYHHHHHDVNCVRFNDNHSGHLGVTSTATARSDQPMRRRQQNINGMDPSITSLHSSGKDSGIVDGREVYDPQGRCQCGHSVTQSSGESSNSYEDSLKSTRRSTRKIEKNSPLTNRIAATSATRSSYHGHHASQISSRTKAMRHSSFQDGFRHPTQIVHKIPMVHPGHKHGSNQVLVASAQGGIARRQKNERMILALPAS